MDAIENLDIHLDTSDRQYYYDYVHAAVVSNPEDAKGKVPEDKGKKVGIIFKNDAHELRVSHITDAHFLDKRFSEKFAPQKSSESKGDFEKGDIIFQSDFSQWGYEAVPRYVMPIYKPGETVRGTVVMTLKKKLEADRLTINFLGRATVNVRIYHRYGYYDCTEHEKFVDDTHCLWQNPSAQDKGEFSSLVGGERILDEGVHEFPFEFKLPEQAPSSVTQLPPKSNDLAYLSYRLKATVDRGKCLGRGNAVTGRGIWVDRPQNVADLSDCLHPVEATECLNTGMFSSGNITMIAKLPRSAFARSEDVPLTLEIDNKSGSAIDSVEARIVLTGRGRTGTSKLSPWVSFSNKAVLKTEGPIASGECPVFDWKLPFDFSECVIDSNMIPTSETSQMSQLLDYRYEVQIKLRRPGIRRNCKLDIPITVGTHFDSPLYPDIKDLSLN